MRSSFAAAVLMGVMAVGVAAQAAHVDYLHVEANVGGSSGGHAAVRIDDYVYHYRNVAGGALRLSRQEFENFRYVYTVAENRSIRVGRIDVSDDTRDRVRDHFNRRYLIEQEHYHVLAMQRDDVAMLTRIVAAATLEPVVPARPGAGPRGHAGAPVLRGVGFFAWGPDANPDRSLVSLRAAVERVRGEGWLVGRIAAIDAEIAALRPDAVAFEARPPTRDRMPIHAAGFAGRFSRLATARMALAALAQARPLASGVLLSEAAPDWRLAGAERTALRAYGVALERRLVELVGSTRADRGEAALIGMARLIAIRESLAAERWRVLDAFPRGSEAIEDVDHPGRGEFLGELHRHARSVSFDARKALIAAETVGEREYNAVEAAANRYLEVRAGIATGRDIRVHGGFLVPYGEFDTPRVLLPRMDAEAAQAALAVARERETGLARSLDAVYGYDLISQNCVSAIFDTLEGALPPDEVVDRLGGRVEIRNTLNFVPFVSFDAVLQSYRVARVDEIPSLRRTQMAAMYARENSAKVYLRESNTLTSSVYRDNPRDPFFLFFTDDAIWPRPIYGAINFIAGIGQAAFGLLRLPFEGPREVVAGAQGAFFSLPELFFVNLRKGSLDYGPSSVARTGLQSEHRAH
jgi:hypothetical protein